MTEEKNEKKNKKQVKSDYIYAVGRRKKAIARVRLYAKKGVIIVNEKPIEEYFPGLINKDLYIKPFKLLDVMDKFSATVKVYGSGKAAQLGAVVHGIARALAEYNEDGYRGQLKKHGLLTRDPRKRERRKVGTGGKARRKKQSPKR